MDESWGMRSVGTLAPPGKSVTQAPLRKRRRAFSRGDTTPFAPLGEASRHGYGSTRRKFVHGVRSSTF